MGELASNSNIAAVEVAEEEEVPKKKGGFSGFSALDYGVDLGEEINDEEDFGGLMVRNTTVLYYIALFTSVSFRLRSKLTVISQRRIKRKIKNWL